MSTLQPGTQFKDIVILLFSEIGGACPGGDMNMLGQDCPCLEQLFD